MPKPFQFFRRNLDGSGDWTEHASEAAAMRKYHAAAGSPDTAAALVREYDAETGAAVRVVESFTRPGESPADRVAPAPKLAEIEAGPVRPVCGAGA